MRKRFEAGRPRASMKSQRGRGFVGEALFCVCLHCQLSGLGGFLTSLGLGFLIGEVAIRTLVQEGHRDDNRHHT